MKVILICILICLQLANYAQSLRMASSYNPRWSVSKCRQVFGQNCERKPSWFVCNCNSNCFSKNTLFLENSLPGTVSNPAMCQMRCKYTKGCKVDLLIFKFYILYLNLISNVLISFSLGHQLQDGVDFVFMIQDLLSCLQDKLVVMWN